MSNKSKPRFTSLSQAVGFATGQLTGLAHTSRYDSYQLPSEVRTELSAIAQMLIDAVKETEKPVKKKEHSTR